MVLIFKIGMYVVMLATGFLNVVMLATGFLNVVMLATGFLNVVTLSIQWHVLMTNAIIFLLAP